MRGTTESAGPFAAALLRAALWIAWMLTPLPAAAQLVDTSQPCNGDQAHKSREWPEHSCNLYWNPHFSVEDLRTLFRAR